MVAHRLSTIRRANLIYVMKNGELVESGTHEELMEKRGHYHDMVVLQEPLDVSWEGRFHFLKMNVIEPLYVFYNPFKVKYFKCKSQYKTD